MRRKKCSGPSSHPNLQVIPLSPLPLSFYVATLQIQSMASSSSAIIKKQQKKLKNLNSKSIKIKKKMKELKKDNVAHLNPKAIEEEVIKSGTKPKKKKKKHAKKPQKTTDDKQQNKSTENQLLEIKKSAAASDLSSNWKNLLKNLPKDEEPNEVLRPAFVRRNKKGQIITNQKMSHPKAIIVGMKDSNKNSKSTGKDTAKEDGEVWFDDVDPMLLDVAKDSRDPVESLVKSNSFKGVTKILGMDCEMVGVGADGVDSILARVSIVNHFGNVLYDKFVAPREKVK